jgi:cyclohexanone monooxygenase
MLGSPDCTPGYYNNEGQDPGPTARFNAGYPQGAMAYFKYLTEWRNSGKFEGLEFR